MKKTYNTPEINIEVFDVEDIKNSEVVTSNVGFEWIGDNEENDW